MSRVPATYAVNRNLFTVREQKAFAAASHGMRRYLLVIGLVILQGVLIYSAALVGAWLKPTQVTLYQQRIIAPTENLAIRNESCLELMRACYARKRMERVKP